MSISSNQLAHLKKELPMPIAQAMGRALEMVRPADKMREWRMVMDMLMGYLNALAVAEYSTLPPTTKVDKYVVVDPQQTDGGRAIQQVSSIFKHLRKQSDVICAPFIRWFYSECEVGGVLKPTHEHLQDMVTLRNDNAHSRIRTADIEHFIEGCSTVLKRCMALREYRLFVVREQEPHANGVSGWISTLMGETPSPVRNVYWSGMRLMNNGVYVLDSSGEVLLRLDPMLVWHEDSDARRQTLFQWRLVRKSIQYNSVLSGCKLTLSLSDPQDPIEQVTWSEWLQTRPFTNRIDLDHGALDWFEPSAELEASEESYSEEESFEEGASSIRWIGLLLLQGGLIGGWQIWLGTEKRRATDPTAQTATIEQGTVSFMLGTNWTDSMQLRIDDQIMEPITSQSLSVGEHLLQIEKDGFQCHSEPIVVETGEQNIELDWDCVGLLGWRGETILGGTFAMGAQKQEVSISKDLWVLPTELTQKMFLQIKGEPLVGDCLDCPQAASWFTAVEFANTVSQIESLEPCYENQRLTSLQCEGYRLPTEAEWEFLAKAGTQQKFAGANSPTSVAYFAWNSDGRAHPVGEMKPNAWGLYDMSGNVYEWCTDDFQELGTYGEDPLVQTGGATSFKVGKGGSYRSKEESVEVNNRTSADPSVTVPFIGFRLVRTLPKN